MNNKLIRWCLNYGFAAFIGLVFLLAGLFKAAHLDGFVAALTYQYPWFPAPLRLPTALVVCLAEWFVGGMLVAGYRLVLARQLAALLFCVFVVFLAAGLVMGVPGECGCFGQVFRFPAMTMLFADSALFLILIALDRWVPKPQTRSIPVLAAVLLVSAFFAFLGATTSLADRYLLRVKPGYTMTQLPSTDYLAPNQGRKRLAIMVKELPDESVVNALHTHYPDHQVVFLILSPDPVLDPDHFGALCLWAKPSLVHHFVKTPPTSFRVDKDEVQEVWYGRLPPLGEE